MVAVAAAMAAVASRFASIIQPRWVPIGNSSEPSVTAVRPSWSLIEWRNPVLRSSGQQAQHAPPGWKCGRSLGGERVSAKGLCVAKKCGVAVVAVGRQQAARDKVVDFGKFKGSLMGTLSSRYLKWMVNNLTAGPLSEWSEYAEEVLADPFYGDRLEWEKVEKLMTAAHDVTSVTGSRDEVFAPARMYGWDLQDDVGWRKVNFSLIGTTKGGRIPRVKDRTPLVVPEQAKPAPKKKPTSIKTTVTIKSRLSTFGSPADVDALRSSGSLQDELMRRRAQRRHRLMTSRGLLSRNDEGAEGHRSRHSKISGRESLLSTTMSYDMFFPAFSSMLALTHLPRKLSDDIWLLLSRL